MTVSINDIRAAAGILAGRVVRTPTVAAPALSEMCGAEIVVKLENLQVTGSFKARGALIKLAALGEAERAAGVVAVSAGNHAQGVAFHAHALGIPATIFMPEATPFTKVGRTEALGAEVVLLGAGVDEAWTAAVAYVAGHDGKTFIHPYDDERVIAGQGTVALEMLDDDPELDAIVVPIGGGGLIAGCAVAAKARKPEIEIYGVQSAAYPAMSDVLKGSAPGGGGPTLAEGIAVKAPGEITRRIIEQHVADIFLVGESDLERAVQIYLDGPRQVVEGAGAASLAAVLANPERFRGRRVGLVVSGGNIDSRILSSVLMRGLVRTGRIVRFRIKVSDEPGQLAKISRIIADAGGNIVEVYHQRLFDDIPIKEADVDVVVETLDIEHVGRIMADLNNAGSKTRLLSHTSLDAAAAS